LVALALISPKTRPMGGFCPSSKQNPIEKLFFEKP
jgi:hypothetical protein